MSGTGSIHPHTTTQAGIQEKQTFLQAYGKKPLFSAPMWLPGLLQVLLLLTGLAVLFHHAPPAASGASGSGSAARRPPFEADEAAGLVTAQLSEADELPFNDSHSA